MGIPTGQSWMLPPSEGDGDGSGWEADGISSPPSADPGRPFPLRAGETIASGAPHECVECGQRVKGPMVMCSAAGFYIGYGGCACSYSYSRESSYYENSIDAANALRTGTYSR